MKKEDFEFILFDRIEKIKQINELLDLEKNSYIAYSGGKDSTVLSYLVDLALPNNKIPRVFSNTGIEYTDMVKYVKSRALKDDRIVILTQTRNIKQTLEKYGYPFKAKEHADKVNLFNKIGFSKTITEYLTKTNGFGCPDILRYQFKDQVKLNFSGQCCIKLKEELQEKWQKENKKTVTITGMKKEEGGARKRLTCLTRKNRKFHPLSVVSEEWEDMFVEIYNIELCKLYYPPFNFKRTGCKGCPNNKHIQEDLLVMKKYLPAEYKQCLKLWKYTYDEYDRIGYRLSYNILNQMDIFDFISKEEENEKI